MMHFDERPPQSAPEASERPIPPGDSHINVAARISPLLLQVFGGIPPVRFVFWDGSAIGTDSGPGTVVFRSPRALNRLLWSPDELGIARAYITGDIELDGSLFDLLEVLKTAINGQHRLGPRAIATGAWAALRLGAIGMPPPRPIEEARIGGRRHSKHRDAAAINHHYDVGNDFYRLVLGPSMTYSCAQFSLESMTLEEAQYSKHDLICKKLGLDRHPGARLLEVGCGWGSMAVHAAEKYKAKVLAVTLSPAQLDFARARVIQLGIADQVEIRLQDYRELSGQTFDAISSIGMFEHVGTRRMDEYFETLFSLLAPTGRLLNHAISTPGGSKMEGRRFINRYVFPDGELIDVAMVAGAMQRAGFEVRDVESLREHYTQTLHEWVENLERSWDDAIRLVGPARARIWRLYMAASANGFAGSDLAIHQVLGVRTTTEGLSGMPRTRDRRVDSSAGQLASGS